MMEKRILGGTGISVSRLCFGALTIGPLQANLTLENGADIIARAIEKGVNFIDTAELYGTLPMIRRAMFNTGKKDLVIATKSYAYSVETAEKSLKKALKEINRDYVDIFLLHEQESDLTLKGHWEAVEYLIRMKEAGHIRAVGLSTHYIAAVKAANKVPEIEILHPLINVRGLGIQDGSAEEMIGHLKTAKASGKGIYGMKPLGGGNLIPHAAECLKWALGQDCLDSIALGMQYPEEVDANIAFFETGSFPESSTTALQSRKRRLLIHDWCCRCGSCVDRCKSHALILGEKKAEVDVEKCILCGYCSAACPSLCIKVI